MPSPVNSRTRASSVRLRHAAAASMPTHNLAISLMSLGYPIGATLGGAVSVYLIAAFGWPSVPGEQPHQGELGEAPACRRRQHADAQDREAEQHGVALVVAFTAAAIARDFGLSPADLGLLFGAGLAGMGLAAAPGRAR
jgi:hypothetical protein